MSEQFNAATSDAFAGTNALVNRLLSAFLLLLTLAALILSFILKPSPVGIGTHTQLGFPPCLLHLLTGIPCPFCGMTTSFALIAHGQILKAFYIQPLGPIFFIACFPVLYASFRGLITAQFPLPAWTMSTRFQSISLGVLLLAWVYNIVRVLISR